MCMVCLWNVIVSFWCFSQYKSCACFCFYWCWCCWWCCSWIMFCRFLDIAYIILYIIIYTIWHISISTLQYHIVELLYIVYTDISYCIINKHIYHTAYSLFCVLPYSQIVICINVISKWQQITQIIHSHVAYRISHTLTFA